MQVNRGELSPDPLGPARRAELEEARRTQAAGRAGQAPALPDEGLSELRQSALVAQRYVARAQSVLGGLEGFRDYLLGEPSGEAEAQEALLRFRYQGEPVLEAHREALLSIAARRDIPLLERWIGTVRQTVIGLAAELARGGTPAPDAGTLRALQEGIRLAGEGLERLQRENVLKLLA
jgi:hypothetical protein